MSAAAAPAYVDAPLSPGAYLKHRRQAARLSVADVAARLGTAPWIHERDRIYWIERIEADVVPAKAETIDALAAVFRFDRYVLATLAGIARGETPLTLAPQLCRICACSWRDPCVTHTHLGHAACAWAERDLCTACVCAPAVGEPA